MTKIWEKEKKIKMNKTVEKFLTGDDIKFDMQLAMFDIKGSIGHLYGLLDAGIVNEDEFLIIKKGLLSILKKIQNGELNISIEDEDIHTLVENNLFKEIGNLAGKLHTARSRNDQIAVDIKLYIKDNLNLIINLIHQLSDNFSTLSKKNNGIPMPGYTHMQPAMPSSVSLWLDSFIQSFSDDFMSLLNVQNMNDSSPLGSAAGYGGSINVDRELVAEKSGFSKVQDNYLYCQNNRGKNELNLIHGLYQVMMTINKFASDALLFSMKQFNFLQLPASFLTGSSIMVQKKNYDVFELLKSKAGLVGGYLNQIIIISNNLNSGYNRNFQDLKKPLIESIEIVLECLEVMNELVCNIKFNKKFLTKSMSKDLYITENVNNLVKQGMPFRTAYKKVASKYK